MVTTTNTNTDYDTRNPPKWDGTRSSYHSWRSRIFDWNHIKDSRIQNNQVGLLLCSAVKNGTEAKRLCDNLSRARLMEENGGEYLVLQLDVHFLKQPLAVIFASWLRHHNCKRGPNEDLHEWMTREAGLASECQKNIK